MIEQNESIKSGFIAILGPTNSGKSTLLNKMIGKRVSIVSSKPQTTLRSVKGVMDGEDYQFVFVDTPGLHQRTELMMKRLSEVVDREASGCDKMIWVFDASNRGMFVQIEKLHEDIKKRERGVCVLNKVDLVAKDHLLPMIHKIHEMGIFTEIIPISAKKGDGIDRILAAIKESSEQGPRFYERGSTTDRSDEFLISEFVREKVYELTKKEIPYAVLVEVLRFDRTPKVPMIEVKISVDSDSRKGILIGAKGSMLKSIGIRARKAIEQHVGKKVCLKLTVDVKSGWRDNPQVIEDYLELS